jgi:hypothetical protein
VPHNVATIVMVRPISLKQILKWLFNVENILWFAIAIGYIYMILVIFGILPGPR